MKVLTRTHVGNVRKINEDSLLAITNVLNHHICIVADGMGGHNAGEVASAIALDVVTKQFMKAEYTDVKEFLTKTIYLANEKIYVSSLTNEEYSKMGTTLSVLIDTGSNVFIGHIGDSRIYYFNSRTPKYYQITRDHTVVQMLYEQGHLKKEELALHPYKNILAQSLGTSSKISADILEIKLPSYGYLLLCSDGLTDELTDEEIQQIVVGEYSLEQKGDILLQSVLQKRAKDNVSFILMER